MTGNVHPSHRRRTQLLGTFSYLLLAGLLVGVPVWLASTAGVPSIHIDIAALRQAVVHHRPGEVREVARWLGRVAVLLAWIAWAWLTVCVLLEVWAWRTGHSPVRLPASRSVQWAAAVLVGTAFAVGALGRVPVPTVGSSPARSGPRVEMTWTAPTAGEYRHPPGGSILPEIGVDHRPTPALDRFPEMKFVGDAELAEVPAGMPSRGAAAPVHTVAERETLWSVAEDHLGAARRWREIAEINYGVPQFDGGALDHTHWILPGWTLRLPPPDGGGHTGTTARPGPAGRPAPLGGPAHEAGAGRTTAAPDPLPLNGPPVTGATTTTARTGADPRSGLGHRPLGLPVAPLGAGIVGVGVADLVDRLRRVQQRHRAVGGQIRMPDATLRPFEQRLRVGGGAGDLDDVGAAVGLLSGTTPTRPRASRLVGVSLDGDRVRLMFDRMEDDEAPPPFIRESDGRTLSVDREALRTTTSASTPEPRFASPTLVSIGRSDGVLVMVSVEGLGSVVIAGDSVAAEGLGRAMALELATSRWAGAFDLVLVGFGGAMAHGDRVSVVTEAGPLIADLTWRRLTVSMRLAEHGMGATDVARGLGVGGEWAPIVIVCAPTVPADDVDALVELAGDGRCGIGVIAMTGGRPVNAEAGCVLRADATPSGASTDVLGTVVDPQSVDTADLEKVDAVLEAALVRDASVEPDLDESAVPAGGPEGGPGETRRLRATGFVPAPAGSVVRIGGEPAPPSGTRPEGGAGFRTIPRSRPGPPPVSRPEHEVEVAVLGPVEVHGAARGFTRAWALELVVYLAMHPGGAANDVWATALWPDRLMAPSSLHSTASVARRSLGTSRDGSDHLPKSHGRLMLARTVGSDWGRFRELAGADDPERWQDALELVRGRPFEGIRATDWALLDGTAPSIEAAVVDVAGRLAGARLRSGDPNGAEWAARKGLLVSPYDERLYRMLLRTADAAGNPGGVESVMAELVRVVADEVEPVESVHPSTLSLYRSLSRRSSAALNGAVRV